MTPSTNRRNLRSLPDEPRFRLLFFAIWFPARRNTGKQPGARLVPRQRESPWVIKDSLGIASSHPPYAGSGLLRRRFPHIARGRGTHGHELFRGGRMQRKSRIEIGLGRL